MGPAGGTGRNKYIPLLTLYIPLSLLSERVPDQRSSSVVLSPIGYKAGSDRYCLAVVFDYCSLQIMCA